MQQVNFYLERQIKRGKTEAKPFFKEIQETKGRFILLMTYPSLQIHGGWFF